VSTFEEAMHETLKRETRNILTSGHYCIVERRIHISMDDERDPTCGLGSFVRHFGVGQIGSPELKVIRRVSM
jgi:hypothetical protein